MIATIELPNNKTELAFILEVLKRLNVSIVSTSDVSEESEDIIQEHTAILRERRTAMMAADAQFFTWENAQEVLKNRKAEKTKL